MEETTVERHIAGGLARLHVEMLGAVGNHASLIDHEARHLRSGIVSECGGSIRQNDRGIRIDREGAADGSIAVSLRVIQNQRAGIHDRAAGIGNVRTGEGEGRRAILHESEGARASRGIPHES